MGNTRFKSWDIAGSTEIGHPQGRDALLEEYGDTAKYFTET
jgi:hypothetical protein